MSQETNKLSHIDTKVFNDSVIDDVIANMSDAFKDQDVDGSTLQLLKQLWYSKLKDNSTPTEATVNPTTEAANATVSPTTEAANAIVSPTNEAIKPTAAIAKMLVPGKRSLAIVANNSAPVPIKVKWILKGDELPQSLRNSLPTSMQLDGYGCMPSLGDESSDDTKDDDDGDGDDNAAEDLEESEGQAAGRDDESLNSGDDPSGEDVMGEDAFESENVIACQYRRVQRCRTMWRFDLTKAVMNISGKDYVVGQLTGDAEF